MDNKQAAGLTILGGAALVIGSFLAWVTTTGEVAAAIESVGEKTGQTGIGAGDGWFTLVAGVVLAAAGWMAYSGKPFPLWVGWSGLLLGIAMTVYEFIDISADIDDLNLLFDGSGLTGGVKMGIGIWVLVAGCVLGLVGLLMGRKKTA